MLTLGLISGLAISSTAHAQSFWSQLQWQIGAGAAGISFPAYRGSAVREHIALPVPALSVRAPRFQLGRDGARINLFESTWLSFRLSASGSLPVDSDDVPLREGMEDLDPSFEIGPAAVIELPCAGRWSCKQETLLRGVIASDFRSASAIGWTLQPRIKIKYARGDRATGQLQSRITFGPLWASRRYHDYFYTVGNADVTASRPAYAASGGFSGYRSSLSVSWRWQRWGASLYSSYDRIDDASFYNSPLVERDDYLMAGVFIRHYFWSSEKQDWENDD